MNTISASVAKPGKEETDWITKDVAECQVRVRATGVKESVRLATI
jgi:hypothetical protein